jgi:hypothetical protein
MGRGDPHRHSHLKTFVIFSAGFNPHRPDFHRDHFELCLAVTVCNSNRTIAIFFDMREIQQGDIVHIGSAKRSDRVISTAQLCHFWLYTCSLSTSSSLTSLKGSLILRWVSRLDAFSAYPVPTWLPSGAADATTGTPAVSPTRSSRTKVRSSQTSNAHHR